MAAPALPLGVRPPPGVLPPPLGTAGPQPGLPAPPQALMLPPAAWQVSLDWTEEEQRALEAALARYPPERVPVAERYIKIAAMLPRKSVRDVTLRVRWTIQHQLGKKLGKVDHLPLPAGGGYAKAGAARAMGPGAAADVDGAGAGSSIDGPVGQLLESNFAILNQFRSNMSTFKVQENTELLVQFRDNILAILSHMEGMGGVMAQMPQLPVRLNVDLANNFLPSRPIASLAVSGQMPQPSLGPGMVPISGFGAGGEGAPPPQPPQPDGGGAAAGGGAPAGPPPGAASSRALLGGAPALVRQDSSLIRQDSAALPFGKILLKQEG
eukprot:scaffold2.g7494.t1